MKRRLLLTGAVAVALGGGTVVAVDRLRSAASAPPKRRQTDTALATVTRRTLTAYTSVTGTLGYAGSYTVVNQAQGVLTALPSVGRTIRRGDVLYRVDGSPVLLLYGSASAYRTLAAGTNASDVTGPDVRQLNANLVALGYAKASELDPDSDEFGWRTTAAVKELQDDLGVEQTGDLELGQVVFLPAALRVTTVQAIQGAPAAPGSTVMEGGSTKRQVVVELETSRQSELKVGDKVRISLPDSRTTPGKVLSIGKVASTPESAEESPTVQVRVEPTDPKATGNLDKAPVDVGIITDKVDDALVVPVESLLALANGGYAVEVVNDKGNHRLVPVSLGLFDDAAGVVQVTDTKLVEGQRVVVPST